MRVGFSRSAAPLLVLAACVGGDKSASSSPVGVPPIVTVRAVDFAFESPLEINAGLTTFRLVNDGPNLHHMQVVRLDSGKTLADLLAAMKKPGMPPAWAVFITGPNAPDPGHESNATFDLQPGNYSLICLVDIPGFVPHIAKGMARDLKVKAATSNTPPVAARIADVTLTLSDYKFELSKPLVAGKQTIAVETSLGQPHEVEILKLAPGKTADDVMKWMEKMEGPPPVSGIGGVGITPHGVKVSFDVDLTPGDFLLICSVPDAKDGKPHVMHGMMQPVKIG